MLKFWRQILLVIKGKHILNVLRMANHISKEDGIVLIATTDEELIKYTCIYAVDYKEHTVPGVKKPFHKLLIAVPQSMKQNDFIGEGVDVAYIPEKNILPLIYAYKLYGRYPYFIIASWDEPEGRNTKIFADENYITTEEFVKHGLYAM